jgi:hypothetical protein
MPRLALLATAAAAALLLVPAATAGEPTDPADRVPEDLPRDAATLRDHLENVSEAQDLDEARSVMDRARPLADDAIPLLRDIQGEDRAGDLLAELWTGAEDAAEAGNLSDLRSLAGSAANTLEDDLEPRARTWAGNGTAVTVGQAEPGDGDRFRLPIVVLNPPPGGLGALDAGLRLDVDEARPVEVKIELGEGEAKVAPENGTARAASFKPKALAGLESVSGPAARFATVLVEPEAASVGDTLSVEVTVRAAADAGGSPVPVIGPDGQAVVPASEPGGLASVPAAWGGLAAVGLMGAGAVVAARRLEV